MSSTSSLDKPSLAMDSALRLFSAETQSYSVQDSLTRKKSPRKSKEDGQSIEVVGERDCRAAVTCRRI